MNLIFLDNIDEFSTRSSLVAEYIKLIAAIRKNPDGYFLDQMRDFHAVLTKALNIPSNACGNIEQGFAKIIDEFQCCTIDLAMATHYRLIKGLAKQSFKMAGPENQEISVNEFFAKLPERIRQMKTIFWVPNYFVIELGPNIRVTDELIDIGPIIEGAIRKVWEYELIGVAVGSGGHETAYIKDQWEANPSWYYCDDMAAQMPGGAHQKLDKLPEMVQKWEGRWNGPEILVYRSVVREQELKKQSEIVREPEKPGDDQNLELLVRALRDLAV